MVAGLGAAGAVHARQASNGPRAIHELQRSIRDDLIQYLREYREAEHISAASAAVGLDGGAVLVKAAAGTTSYGGEIPVTPRDYFEVGSITKSFTAVILLQLQAERKLKLSDPIGKWLPQYPQWKGVTIRQLLNMTSGIPGVEFAPAFENAYAKAPRRNFSLAEVVGYVNGLPPTTGYSYSDTNYLLAQMIIRKVTHHSYAFELAKRIFRPLPLHQTFYNGGVAPARIQDAMPAGYFVGIGTKNAGFKPLYGRDTKAYNLSVAGAAGGIISTPEDIARWVYDLFQGPMLSPEQRKQLTSLVSMKTGKPIASTNSSDPNGYGLGVVQSYQGKLTGPLWFYQGGTFGYRMEYVYVPKADVVVVIALNSITYRTQNHINRLLQAIFADLKPELERD